MSAYLMPIKVALLLFPFLALAISSIFLCANTVNLADLFFTSNCTLFICFYLLCAYFLVILPLPSIEEVAQMTGPKMEWQLGASWQHFCSKRCYKSMIPLRIFRL